MNAQWRVPATVLGGMLAALALLSTFSAIPQLHAQETSPPGDPVAVVPGAWQPEPVDAPKKFSDLSDRSIQVDADGVIHIVYGGDHLYYARFEEGAWQTQTVDDAPWVGEAAVLALDALGHPHIGYVDRARNQVLYSRFDGVAWQKSVVATLPYAPSALALALDATGDPHFAYVARLEPTAEISPIYTWWNGDVWQSEVIEDFGEGWAHSIALDLASTGQPVIAYIQANVPSWPPPPPPAHHRLRVGSRTAGGWQIEQIYEFYQYGENDRSLSLALDSNDLPHLALEEHGDSGPSYFRRDVQGWTQQPLLGTESGVAGIALALDALDQPLVSYLIHAGDTISVEVRRLTGGAWQTQLAATTQSGGSPALAVDGAGQAVVGFRDIGRLRTAHEQGATWDSTTVDDEADVGWGGALALDAAGRAHVVYYDSLPGQGHLKYALQEAHGWSSEIVDPFAGADISWWGNEYAAIAVDGSNRPHLAYVAQGDPGGKIVRYAVLSGTTWLSTTMGAGAYPALALDHHGHPHLAYAGWDDGIAPLHYTWYDGSVWQTEDVVTSSVDAVTLALDSSDMPHLGYTMFGYGDAAEIHYARRTQQGWLQHVVDTGGWGTADLTLDQHDLPHMVYLADGLWKYAHLDSAQWETEPLAPFTPARGRLAVAVDQADRPHVVYYVGDPWKPDVIYARRGAQGWETTQVAQMASSADLALDQAGNPHLIYRSVANADLLYTRWWPALTLYMHATPTHEIAPGEPFSLSIGLQGNGLLAAWRMPIPAGAALVAGSLSGAGSHAPDENAVIWAGRLPTATLQMTHLQLELTTATQDVPVVVSTVFTDTERGASAVGSVIVNGKRVFLPRVEKATP